MASDPGDLARGRQIAGRYRVGAPIGRGGMALVYDALDLELDRRVALKVLRRDLAGSTTVKQRFVREARAAAKLASDHVALVLDVGAITDGGSEVPYIVMERLEGRDLRQVIEERGSLAPEVAIDYVLMACVALAEAHARGMVHRDLKPSNLFLTRGSDGAARIKVLDFGIAKALAGERPDPGLTSIGEVLGSPRYMSPEQLRAATDVDARSDIWSLGVVLYELIAGEPPFAGAAVAEVHAEVLEHTPVPIGARRAGLPAGLESAIHRALMKDRSLRYPSVVAMARVLAPFGSAVGRACIEPIERHAHGKRELERVTSPAIGAFSGDSIDTGSTTLAQTPEGPVQQTHTAWDASGRGGRLRARSWLLAAATLAMVAIALVLSVGGGDDAASATAAKWDTRLFEVDLGDLEDLEVVQAAPSVDASVAAPVKSAPRARPRRPRPAPAPQSPYDERE